jgi:hypothetical protein
MQYCALRYARQNHTERWCGLKFAIRTSDNLSRIAGVDVMLPLAHFIPHLAHSVQERGNFDVAANLTITFEDHAFVVRTCDISSRVDVVTLPWQCRAIHGSSLTLSRNGGSFILTVEPSGESLDPWLFGLDSEYQ